jgi:hypothetical protein
MRRKKEGWGEMKVSFTHSSGAARRGKRAEHGRGLTFEFEGEIIRQMSAFVITSQKEEGVGVRDLERP